MERRASSRRKKKRFFYPEKRTGFDRRNVDGGFSRILLFPAGRPGSFLKVLLAVNVLSILDFLLTLDLMDLGIISEGNPFLAVLIWLNPLAALAFKVSVMLTATMIFWRFRRYRTVILTATSTLGLFGVLVSYQLVLLVLA